MDGDLAYPLALLETIEKGLTNHDVIIGSRRLLNSEKRPDILRRILGEGYNRLPDGFSACLSKTPRQESRGSGVLQHKAFSPRYG